jgi:hypothetical protein
MLIPLLALLPLRGQELGLLLDKQISRAEAFSARSFDGGKPSGTAIRLGGDLLNLRVLALQLNATYHPKTTSDISVGGARYGELDRQYLAAGAQVTWRLLLNVGAGVELRAERQSWRQNPALPLLGSGESTVTRPWGKVNVGFSLPTPILKPFVMLELAAPLSKKDAAATPRDLSDALAPQAQVGLYGGIRF